MSLAGDLLEKDDNGFVAVTLRYIRIGSKSRRELRAGCQLPDLSTETLALFPDKTGVWLSLSLSRV